MEQIDVHDIASQVFGKRFSRNVGCRPGFLGSASAGLLV